MAVALLEDWCKGMDLDPRKALLIVGIPVECSVAKINDILKTGLHSLGAYTVIGRMFRREDNAKAVLIELNGIVDYAKIPRKIMGNGVPWEVVVKPHTPDEEFKDRLASFLKNEGRRMVDVARILGYNTYPMEGKGTKDQGRAEGMWYRKLKLFTGNAFQGQGEEPFESWFEEATEMMKLWQVSEGEKRRRLLESLGGSALSIMRLLRANDDSLTVEQCLDALKQIFGTKEDCRISKFRLLQCSQRPAEKLSDYLLRLEPLLHRAVEQSPVCRQSIDTLRLKHILSQVSIIPALKGKLALLDQRGCPPTFLELMKLTRNEEEWETATVVIEQQQRQIENIHQASVKPAVAKGHRMDNQDTTEAGILREVSTQTIKQEVSFPVKRKRQTLADNNAKDELVEIEGSGNDSGVGTLSHPNPIGSRATGFPSQSLQQRDSGKEKGQPRETSENTSGAEGEGSIVQGKALCCSPARKHSTVQNHAVLSFLTTKCKTLGMWYAQNREAADQDSGRDTSEAEAKDARAGGSEMRISTCSQANWGRPFTGLPWSEASACGTVVQGGETGPQRGGRRVQPVFRINYTALGEPQECHILEDTSE